MESGSPPPYTQEVVTASRSHLAKTIWRVFMITNFGIAAYLVVNTSPKKKSKLVQAEAPPPQPESPPPQPENPPPVDFGHDPQIVPSSASFVELLPPRKPIPEDQQKELFQWMLEEKRKIKPKDREEKKRIDQEKAILKQFIEAENPYSVVTTDPCEFTNVEAHKFTAQELRCACLASYLDVLDLVCFQLKQFFRR